MDAGRIKLLSEMPIFGGFLPESLECLLKQVEVLTLDAGEFLLEEGDPAQEVYVLEEGRCSIIKNYAGIAHVINEVGNGDCLGEVAVIDPGPRSASIKTLTPCRFLVIHGRDFYRLRSKSPSQFALLQMNIAREVCRRLRMMEENYMKLLLEKRSDMSENGDNH